MALNQCPMCFKHHLRFSLPILTHELCRSCRRIDQRDQQINKVIQAELAQKYPPRARFREGWRNPTDLARRYPPCP